LIADVPEEYPTAVYNSNKENFTVAIPCNVKADIL